MQVIQPQFEIHKLVSWEDMLKHIEQIGRTCYKSNDLITEDSYLGFIRGLIDRGHEAMIEHVTFSVCFVIDRGVTRNGTTSFIIIRTRVYKILQLF